jgi:hypothetical protein
LFEAKAYEIDELAAIYDSAVRNGGTMMTSNEEDLLTNEVSDEALEAAGRNAARNFTMAACTYHVGGCWLKSWEKLRHLA